LTGLLVLAAASRVLLLLTGALTATALLAATLLSAALTGLLVLLAALARTIVRVVRHGRFTPVVQSPVQGQSEAGDIVPMLRRSHLLVGVLPIHGQQHRLSACRA
jgi:hypothetical protein